MGRKSKLRRFAEVGTFSNVFEHVPGNDFHVSNEEGQSRIIKGQWARDHFQNELPVVLELACGKGDYTLALAQTNSDTNYIGIDIKGARIWKGARHALNTNIANAAFLRTRIEFVERFFNTEEVAEIWITFPDPFVRKPSRRLTAPGFIARYRNILKPGGIVHLKTDSWLLYEYTLDVIHADPRCKVIYANPDIYSCPLRYDDLRHHTYYERMHLAEGRTIKYVRFTIS